MGDRVIKFQSSKSFSDFEIWSRFLHVISIFIMVKQYKQIWGPKSTIIFEGPNNVVQKIWLKNILGTKKCQVKKEARRSASQSTLSMLI